MSISLVSRADDLGSSHTANVAIAGAAVTGDYIKNVSCMAVGPWIDEGAELLQDRQNVCLGLHAALNSEWDPLKWGPVSPPENCLRWSTRRVPSLSILPGSRCIPPISTRCCWNTIGNWTY
jgi:hypothetical protein